MFSFMRDLQSLPDPLSQIYLGAKTGRTWGNKVWSSCEHSPLETAHGVCSPNHCQTKIMGNQRKEQFLGCLKNSQQTTKNFTARRKPKVRHLPLPNLFLPTMSLLPHKMPSLHQERCRKHHLQVCFSKLLRKSMGTVPLFQARGEIWFLQDAACIRFHLERICITKPHKPFLLHGFWKCFVCLESLEARL